MKHSFLKLASVATVALAASVASAEYIYAYISETKDLYQPERSISFDYATFKADGSETPLPIGSGEAVASAGEGASSSTASAFYVGSADTQVTTSLLVELWVESQEGPVGWRQFSYAQIAPYVFSNTGGSGDTYLTISEVVPEPASGLLLLFGLAGLALRRKRV